MFYEKLAFKTIEHWLNFMFVMLKIFLSDSASNFLRDRIKNKHTDNQKTNKQTTSNRNTNTCNNTKPLERLGACRLSRISAKVHID